MKRNIFAFIIFLFLSLILTWPLLFNLTNILQVSYFPVGGHQDNFIYISTMHHFINKVLNFENPFFIKEIFYPCGLGVYNNEFPPLYLFFGLFLSFFNINEFVSHNLFFILTIIFSGFFMYLLIYEFLKNKYASIFGGFLYISSNFILYFYDGITNLQFQWIPLCFFFIERIIKKPNYKNGIFLGFAIALQLFSHGEYFLFLTIILPIYVLFRISFKFSKKLIYTFSIALITFLISSSWYIFILLRTQKIVRPLSESLLYSFDFSLFSIISNHGFYFTFPLILSILSISFFIKKQKTKNNKGNYWLKPIFIIALIGLLFSLGPLTNFSLYALFYKFWPMADTLRSPVRFLIFPLIFLCISSSYFVKSMIERKINKLSFLTLFVLLILIIVWNLLFYFGILPNELHNFPSGGESTSSSVLAFKLLIDMLVIIFVFTIIKFVSHFYKIIKRNLFVFISFMLLAFYFLSISPYFNTHKLIDFNNRPENIVYSYINNLSDTFVIVEYPFNEDANFNINQLYHNKKIVNGYGSNIPECYKNFKDICGYEILSNTNKCKNLLRSYHIKYVIYNANYYSNWGFFFERLKKDNSLSFVLNGGNAYLFEIK